MKATITTAALAVLLALSQNFASAQQSTQDTPQQSAQPAAEQSAPPVEQQDNSSGNANRGGRSNRSQAHTNPAQQQSSSTSDANAEQSNAAPDAQGHQSTQQSEDEAAIAASYNNFFEHYRLGPEDVVSITVFGQERYSKQGIVIPPNGRLYHPLVPEGIFVNGRTVEEVTQELKKRFDEYIIDPQVSVSLDRAVSYRYSVLGEVAQPGVKQMNRRLTAYEAVSEAGGVLGTGSKKNVMIVRRQPDGTMGRIMVDMAAIERGRLADNFYLRPGDQIIVPGNNKKKWDGVLKMLPILSFARIFVTGGF
ncbi:MAG TPA: polysaccharide biosynthesis/export family protein [Pyrinomonadaceae bacterium]|nr:polysaccharide biosynthesis/export family protein [Pyrinomonadaceae bacterium]